MSESSSEPSKSLHLGESEAHTSLKQKYQDTTINDMTREHAFFAYWMSYLTTRRFLPRRDLEDMVGLATSRGWLAPLGDCLRTAAVMNILPAEDIEWLLQELPGDSYAWKQISALHLLKDQAVAPDVKLTRLLELRTDWAIRRLIDCAPVQSLNNWIEIIKASRRPKGAKHDLLEHLRKTMAALKV